MSDTSSKKVVVAALVANFLIAVSKFFAAALSGSIAMLAEAFHSVADTGNQILLLVGFKRSRLPADELHPFGYGMETYFWTFVVGVSMFTIGAAVSVYEGISRLIHPHELGSMTISYVVLSLSILFEGVSWTIAFSELRKNLGSRSIRQEIKNTKSPALIVVFLEDSAALLGLLMALAGVILADLTQNPFFDGIASIAIGLLLAFVAFIISYETKSLLVGEGLGKENLIKVRDAIEAVPEVTRLCQLLTMHLSPENVLINCQVSLRDGLDIDGVEQVTDRIELAVKKALPWAGQIFVEIEDWNEENRGNE